MPGDGPQPRAHATRLLLVGYYGAGLAGDEAILRVLVRDLTQRCSGASITATSADPVRTTREMGVRAVALDDLRQLVSAIAESDLVVLGGGGLFNEYAAFRPLDSLRAAPAFNTLCAEVPALAAAHGVPCVICAAGVEPQTSPEARAATRRAFTLATAAAVRDTSSLEALAALGPPLLRVVQTCDPAAMLEARPWPRVETLTSLGLDAARPVLTVTLRHWDPEPQRLSEEPQPWEAEAAAGLAAFCVQRDFQLLLVPSQQRGDGWIFEDDVAFCQRWRERLGAVRHAVWTSDLAPDAVAGAIALGELGLAMRHHGVIFAAAAGVPCAAIAYAPKVAGAMRDAGLARYVQPLAGLTADSLQATLQRLWQEAPAARQQLEALRRQRVADHERTLELVEAGLRGTLRTSREVALAEAARRWLVLGLDARLDDALEAAIVSLLHYAFNGEATPETLRQPVETLRARYPGDPAVAYYYGYVEAVAGEHLDAAAAALTEAITASFTPAWAHFNRAKVRLQLGDEAGARADLEAALAIDPALTLARECLNAMTGAPVAPDASAG